MYMLCSTFLFYRSEFIEEMPPKKKGKKGKRGKSGRKSATSAKSGRSTAPPAAASELDTEYYLIQIRDLEKQIARHVHVHV